MKLKKSWIALIAVSQLLAACTESMQKTMSNVRIAQNGEPTSNGPQISSGHASEQMGTGDGGGGNAINFKMLESYMLNPNELEVVKRRVKPLLDKAYMSTDEDNQAQIRFDFFSMKNWYFAPIDLKVIPKDVLGIEITQGGHQQVALQTRNAIWVDSNIFEKMNDEEKARLLVHEVMMMFYLNRFEAMADVCKMYAKGASFDTCRESEESDDGRLAPEARRPLNSADYEAIRNMTNWLMLNESTVTYESLELHASKIGFADPRFSVQVNNKESIKVNRAMVIEALSAAYHSGALEKECVTEKLKITSACELRFRSIGDMELEVFLIEPETQKVLKKANFFFHKESEIFSHMSGHYSMMSAVNHSRKDGARFDIMDLLFRVVDSGRVGLRLDEVKVFPKFVAAGEKIAGQLCTDFRIESPYPQDFSSDIISLKRADVKSSPPRGIGEISGCDNLE